MGIKTENIVSRVAQLYGDEGGYVVEKQIKEYLKEQTTTAWSNIAGYMMLDKDDTHISIWEAVRKLDPTFPKRGRAFCPVTGTILKDWERIPDPFLVLRAIQAYAR